MNDADHALKEIAAEEIDEVDIIMEDINDEIADLQESITNSSLTLSSSTGSLPGGTNFKRFKKFRENFFFFKMGNRILRYGCRTFDTFWVPDDIESCNFQNLLVFGFPETSQNFMPFRQLLFSLTKGPKEKI